MSKATRKMTPVSMRKKFMAVKVWASIIFLVY